MNQGMTSLQAPDVKPKRDLSHHAKEESQSHQSTDSSGHQQVLQSASAPSSKHEGSTSEGAGFVTSRSASLKSNAPPKINLGKSP